MNPRLRNRLSALALAASLGLLGYALGESSRPGSRAAPIGKESVATIAMPFFSFGKRASVGAR